MSALALTDAQLGLLRWWAEGERPYRWEWLDAEGRVLAQFDLRAGPFRTTLPAGVPEAADMVRVSRAAGGGLETRRWSVDDWRAIRTCFTGPQVNVTGLAAIAATRPPPGPAPTRRRTYRPRLETRL